LEVFPVTKILASAAILTLSASLAACGGGSAPQSLPTTGQLNLKITDAPVDDAREVWIVFTGVELQPASGTRVNIDFDPPYQKIDLLAYQNGATADLLNGATVPAGDYNWMRLKVIAEKNRLDGSKLVLDTNEEYSLYIPSGAESGLKLNRPFRVAVGSVTNLVADFDLQKSIIKPKGQDPNYVLKPVLRLMDQLQTGTLAGTVDFTAVKTGQLGSQCTAGVYLFERPADGPAEPDDADGDVAGDEDGGSDPLIYKSLDWDGLGDTVDFSIAFLLPGHYTVAATCDYAVDASPEANEYRPNATSGAGFETMRWSIVDDVEVRANETNSPVPVIAAPLPTPPST
jgi:hypothetical protein